MKEDFLHYVWQYKLFDFKDCRTTQNEPVSIVHVGNYNLNSGPDFLYSQLKIDHQTWVGNVEIHKKSSDWYAHKHEKDKSYDAVILHVVYEHDVDVFMKNNKPLPTLVLKNLISEDIFEEYEKLINQRVHWISCERQLPDINSVLWKSWLKNLYFERLEQKSALVRELLTQTNNDFEAVLFQLLAKNFGLKVNGDVFLQLAKSIDFSIVRKESFNEKSLASLLFGQAGFLSDETEIPYQMELKQEYEYLAHKYTLSPLENNQFSFFRMRPNNFPTIRLGQLVALFNRHQNLFSKVISLSKPEDFYKLFLVEVNDFWKEHYTFETPSKKSLKKLTKQFVDLLIINTIIPLKYVYLQLLKKPYKTEILNIMHQLKPEKNKIIDNFSALGITAQNAFESQALIQLKKAYCTPKYCLKCAIGKELLGKNN